MADQMALTEAGRTTVEQQAAILAEATGLSAEQALAVLQAQAALQAGSPAGTVMRNSDTGQTAVRVLAAPGSVPVWAIVAPDNPFSHEHRPPDLPPGTWAEMSLKSEVAQ